MDLSINRLKHKTEAVTNGGVQSLSKPKTSKPLEEKNKTSKREKLNKIYLVVHQNYHAVNAIELSISKYEIKFLNTR